jgi:hypothetical protein
MFAVAFTRANMFDEHPESFNMFERANMFVEHVRSCLYTCEHVRANMFDEHVRTCKGCLTFRGIRTTIAIKSRCLAIHDVILDPVSSFLM